MNSDPMSARPADQAVTTCPTCKRSPSMRLGHYPEEHDGGSTEVESDECPDPIHDLADRLVADALTGSAPETPEVHRMRYVVAAARIVANDWRDPDSADGDMANLRTALRALDEDAPAAPGAVETPLREALALRERMKNREMSSKASADLEALAELIRAALKANAGSAESKLALHLQYHYAPIADALNAALRQVGRDEIGTPDLAEIQYGILRLENAATMAKQAARLAASPSAERILTQATPDLDEVARDVIQYMLPSEDWKDPSTFELVRDRLAKHFPARSVAAVVMPNEHTPSPTATEYQEGQDVGWNKCLAEFRRLNPAPSTASATGGADHA